MSSVTTHALQTIVSCLAFLALPTAGNPIGCSAPPNIDGARIDHIKHKAPYEIGTSITYVCDAGYVMVGDKARIHCNRGSNAGTWEMPTFTCQPVACGDPGDIANGVRVGQLWTFKHKVEYLCDEGYVLTAGSNVRYCQASRRWSGQEPVCTSINCTQPENPEHGFAIYNALTYGAIVKYECTHQRAVHGDQRRVCESNGHWSGVMPRCVEVDCGPPFDAYLTGTVKVLRGTRLNDVIQYKCNNGHMERALCQYPGVWLPPPPDCMELTSTISTSTTAVEKPTNEPRKKSFFCRWKLFQWLCQ